MRTLYLMDKPTHHDVDVILKLYELRREDRMRKARGWLFGYKASNGTEHQAACPPDRNRTHIIGWLPVIGTWRRRFVTSGALNKELFLQSAGEMLFVWEKTKGTIPIRERPCKYLSNLETMAQASDRRREQRESEGLRNIFGARARHGRVTLFGPPGGFYAPRSRVLCRSRYGPDLHRQNCGRGFAAQSAFTESGVDYAVEPDKYSGGVIFRSERVGAFFYVLPEAAQQARSVMQQHGFHFHEWGEEEAR